MKNLFTLIIFVFGLATTMTAQTEKAITKSIDLEETHTAYVMLPGNVEVSEWNESYMRITATITVENMSETVVKRLIIVGRYNIETRTDKFGKMMVVEMPNVANFVAVQGVDLLESYTFEISAPKGYRVVVKEDLNPKANQHNGTLLGQSL